MAIALRAIGTRLKADLSAGGSTSSQLVSLPAGHVSGDGLLMFVLTDDNTNTTNTPAGWNLLFYITNGSSVASPYTPRPRLKVYQRIDSGSLGSTVTITFNVTSNWPTGKPSVLAFIAAYSGVDSAAFVGEWAWRTDLATTAAQAHPAITTSRANDWLLTYRAVSSDSPGATFTDSVGTDVERQDDIDLINELACALYDSNTALTAGLQTTRTTTASRTATYGSLLVSIAIQPPSGAAAATAAAQTAEATGTAYNASVTSADGPWAFCSPGGLPVYRFAVDWNGDGSFTDPSGLGTTLVSDTFSRTVSSGWGAADTGQTWTTSGGSASDYAVGSGTGTQSLGTRNVSRYCLVPSSTADTDMRVTFSTDQVAAGDSFLLNLLARELTTSDYYSARAELTTAQAIVLSLRKTTTGPGDSSLGSFTTTLTHVAGTTYTIRLRVQGSSLYAKIWDASTTEPGTWQVTATDTDLTAAGSAGVRSLLRTATTNTLPVTFTWDNFTSSVPTDPEDVTPKITSEVSISYGRDQDRQLNPAAVGSSSFTVINVDRVFSPDFSSSVLFGDLEPARQVKGTVTFGGNVYPLMYAKIDDYNIRADQSDRTVDFTFLDGLADLQNVKLSTGVYQSMRTGDLISVILDQVGWTGGRDIGLGATVVPYWWVEGTDALTAITDLVKSEGPPSVAYQAPDGTFVFRDRHHRLQRSQSTGVQATFAQPTLMDCNAVPLAGLDFTAPFTYAHGWRDIINSVSFEVAERTVESTLSAVWTSDDSSITLGIGESEVIDFSTSDPFTNAVTPVQGVDYTLSGPGTLNVVLSRTSGQSATISLLAVGGAVVVSSLQVRAQAISVRRNIKVTRQDPGSITLHGEKSYPESAPWANANDADAIAGMILLHYATRRPTIQLRVTSQDPAHFVQALTRTVSDRIHVRYDEMGIDEDFFVERITHTIQRMNAPGRPPVHAVVLGCERNLVGVANPFTFDKRGAGFDQGVFDPVQADNADTVFIFDHPTQGQFDVGLLGT